MSVMEGGRRRRSSRSTRKSSRHMKMRGGNDENYNNSENSENSENYNNSENYETNNSTSNMEGGAKLPTVGSKAQVWHGNAKHTSGGLTRKDLMKTKKGRIVSRAKHALGKKALKNLKKAGFVAKKGTFKLFRK